VYTGWLFDRWHFFVLPFFLVSSFFFVGVEVFVVSGSRLRNVFVSMICARFIMFQILIPQIVICMEMGHMMSTSNELSHSMKKLRLSQTVRDGNHTQAPIRLADIFDVSSPFSPYRKQAGRHGRILEDAIRAPLGNWSTIGSIDLECVTASMDDVALGDHAIHSHEETPMLHCELHASTDDGASHVMMVPEHVSGDNVNDCGDGISNNDLLSFLRASECKRDDSISEVDGFYDEHVHARCSSGVFAVCSSKYSQYIEPTNAELLLCVKKK
jgi:hypothetical protein